VIKKSIEGRLQHALFTKEINKIIPENQILKQIKKRKNALPECGSPK
jgi:hypothetical protein